MSDEEQPDPAITRIAGRLSEHHQLHTIGVNPHSAVEGALLFGSSVLTVHAMSLGQQNNMTYAQARELLAQMLAEYTKSTLSSYDRYAEIMQEENRRAALEEKDNGGSGTEAENSERDA